MEFDKNLPLYWQIIETVRMRIISKEYSPGMMIPSVRALGKEFGVTGNTIQRAYYELVRDGLVIPVRGLGYKVTDDKRKLNKLREQALESRLKKFHEDCQYMGITNQELSDRLNQFINR